MIPNDSVFCPSCGAKLSGEVKNVPVQPVRAKPSTLSTVAFVFMVISTVCSGFFLIPLAWMLPMTLTFKSKVDRGEPIGTGFKICILLFVSLLAGIFTLCDEETD